MTVVGMRLFSCVQSDEYSFSHDTPSLTNYLHLLAMICVHCIEQWEHQ